MAKTSLAGADGALTWVVSAAGAGRRIVRGPRELRGGGRERGGLPGGPCLPFSLCFWCPPGEGGAGCWRGLA